jgi:sulfur relay (sulfurtransferase) complex TusBCD TusD component (DsrE family)
MKRLVMKVLIVVNGPAYGSDETFNALRLAIALSKRDDAQPRVFLMGDASLARSTDRRLRMAITRSIAC